MALEVDTLINSKILICYKYTHKKRLWGVKLHRKNIDDLELSLFILTR